MELMRYRIFTDNASAIPTGNEEELAFLDTAWDPDAVQRRDYTKNDMTAEELEEYGHKEDEFGAGGF